MRPRAALSAAIVAVLALLISGISPAVAAATTYRVDTTLRLPGQTSDLVTDAHRGVLYVMVPNSHLIRMFDADSLAVLGDVPVGAGAQVPRQMAVDPVSGMLLVTVSLVGVADPDSFLAVVDPGAGAVVATLPVGGNRYGVTVAAEARVAYLSSSMAENSYAVVDLTDPSAPALTATVALPGIAERIIEAPDGAHLYGISTSSFIWVLDPATGAVVETWSGFRSPHQMTFTADGTRAYVTQQLGTSAAIVDLSTGATVGSIDLPNTYFQADDQSGTILMTAPFLDGGSVGFVAADTGELLGTIPARSAYRIAVDPSRDVAFVGSIDTSGVVTVLRAVRPPRVLTQPVDVTVAAGDQAIFTATAEYADRVQWQRSDDGVVWSDVSGATTGTFTLRTATDDEGALFRAVFVGADGSVTTEAAVLTVTAPTPVDPVTPDPVDPVTPDPVDPVDPVTPDPVTPEPVIPVDPSAVVVPARPEATISAAPPDVAVAPADADPVTSAASTAPAHGGLLAITGVPVVGFILTGLALLVIGVAVVAASSRDRS
jgi:hypothetical protein